MAKNLLSKYARPVDSIMRDFTAFETRVAELSRSLEHVVKNALDNEAESVSADWIDEAKGVLQALSDDRDHAPDAARSEEELRRLQASLAKGLDRGSLKPSPEEIAAQTRDVARTALDEWMTRLNRAHRETPKTKKLFLNAEALPNDESLVDLLGRVEVFGVPAEAVATVLIVYICDVLAAEKRFSISDELYILEDMTSRNYLLVVEGTQVEPAPFARRVETVLKELILGEEICTSEVLPLAPAAIAAEAFRVTQFACKLTGGARFRSPPLERLTVGCVAVAGALALHPQAKKHMGLRRWPAPGDPVLERLARDLAAVAEVEQKDATTAMKVIIKTSAAPAVAGKTPETVAMQSVYAELKASFAR
jgi:hypothetical protein